ncbi:hypothetical protein CCICO_04500 [Corynebacterium ciconiae DSM 44920]|uniref:hypothetical protein n=1 Tax=Corynebacterium ciconiae TaxID=227319 RepID=UPI00264A0DE1|nr:hypothetical protein [Corynebacterium ciconiae]WKD60937.1 hypothetical protein CCICO_04500 [Corynebacterium ciconiae DSM 44920]
MDAQDIAYFISGKYGMDEHAAAESVENYISQIEKTDSTTIDRDDISDDDRDFLIEAVKNAHESGDMARRELELVEDLSREVEQAEDTLKAARWQRDKAIRDAFAAGARGTDIIAASGLTSTQVYRLKNKS